MPRTISVRRALETRALRCAICHDGIAESTRCSRCATAFHADCRGALRRCPSLGCAGEGPRTFRFARALALCWLSAGLTVLAALLASSLEDGPRLLASAALVGCLALHFVVLPTRWTRQARPDKPLFDCWGSLVGTEAILFLVMLIPAHVLERLAPSAAPFLVGGVLAFMPACVPFLLHLTGRRS